jgi:hypothetical protein
MPSSTHLFKRQALHWFRWVLSTGHLLALEPRALHIYWRFRRIDRYFDIRLSNLEVVKTNMTQVLKHFLYLEKTGASVKGMNEKTQWKCFNSIKYRVSVHLGVSQRKWVCIAFDSKARVPLRSFSPFCSNNRNYWLTH